MYVDLRMQAVASLGKAMPLGFEVEVLECLGERSRVVKRTLSPSWLSSVVRSSNAYNECQSEIVDVAAQHLQTWLGVMKQ